MSRDTFDITWYVEDGYVTGDRPQRTHLDLDDFEDDMTVQDIQAVIAEAIDNDFKTDLSWSCGDICTTAQEIFSALQARQAEAGEDA